MVTNGRASGNKSDMTITWPTGAQIQFTNITDEQSYARHQGRSYTGLFGDEVSNYPPSAFTLLQHLRSNLRVRPGLRPEVRYNANPNGLAHSILMKDFIGRAPAWTPFRADNDGEWIWTHSTYRDNPHIDREAYEQSLRAACGGDTELLQAWLDGDWRVRGGVLFANFDPDCHLIQTPRDVRGWKFRCGADWGSAAPAVALLLGVTLAGDIVALEEFDTACDPNDLNVGNGMVAQAFTEELLALFRRWGRSNVATVCDDARGLHGASDTVVGLLQSNGISAHKPTRKNRVGGWDLMRQCLEGAKLRNGPGLYIVADKCPHLVETLSTAPRGQLRPEDCDPRFPDHWLDALRYAVGEIYPIYKWTSGTTVGMY